MIEPLDSRLLFAANLTADVLRDSASALTSGVDLAAPPPTADKIDRNFDTNDLGQTRVPVPAPTPTPVPTPIPTPLPTPTPTTPGAPSIILKTIATTITAGQAFHGEATATLVPGYQAEDATFTWNFGDPAGRWNVLPGFNSAHVYDNPGTYAAKLTVVAPGGQSTVQSVTVNVIPSTAKIVYVSAAGSDSKDGLTAGNAVKTLTRALAVSGDNTKILFNRGDTFPLTSVVSIVRNNLTIGAYGTGANPILMYTGARTGTPNMLFVDKASSNIVIQGLTFDSSYTTNFNEDGMPHAIVAGGTAVTVRDSTFLNLAYAINANYQPRGLLVMDNVAPSATGLRAYFVWCEGSDLVIVGNKVANSTRQHNVRSGGTDRFAIVYNSLTNLNRQSNGDTADVAKGTIVAQKGTYTYAAYNQLRGPVGVGPLGQQDGLTTKGARFNHAAFEGNVISGGGTLDVHHGANNITLRGNSLYTDEGMPTIKVEGWSNAYGRGVSDVVIDRNVGITQGQTGQFLWLLGVVDGVTLTNNVYIAPNLKPGSASTAAVTVVTSDLSSFRIIDNNTWPSGIRGTSFARGGMTLIGVDYKTNAEWNAMDRVGTDQFVDVLLDSFETVANTSPVGAALEAPTITGRTPSKPRR